MLIIDIYTAERGRYSVGKRPDDNNNSFYASRFVGMPQASQQLDHDNKPKVNSNDIILLPLILPLVVSCKYFTQICYYCLFCKIQMKFLLFYGFRLITARWNSRRACAPHGQLCKRLPTLKRQIYATNQKEGKRVLVRNNNPLDESIFSHPS